MKKPGTKCNLALAALLLVLIPVFSQGQSKYNKKSDADNTGSYNSSSLKISKTVSRWGDDIVVYLDSAQYLSSLAPMRAIDLINKAVELSIQRSDEGHEGQAYWILGNIQQGLGQHELAIENYNKCISVLGYTSKRKSIDKTNTSVLILFRAYKNKATSLLALDKLPEAESSINTCLGKSFYPVPETEKLEAGRVKAKIFVRNGKNDEALKLLMEGYDDAKELAEPAVEIESLSALGEYYQQQSNEAKALEYFTTAKVIAEKYKNERALLKLNNLMAQTYRQQRNTTKELEMRTSNMALANNSNNKEEFLAQTKQMSDAYIQSRDFEKAAPYMDKMFYEPKLQKVVIPEELFSKSNDLEGIANSYKQLAEVFLKSGDTEKALVYLGTFVVIQDSIRSIRKRELEEALRVSNQIGKNQQRIDLLEKERELSEKSIEVLRQDKELKEDELKNRNIVIGSLSLLIFFLAGGVYFILRSSREKRRANQLLAIKSLRGQMNPHFIFNALNSVNHYISQNDERSANKYLSDFSKLMRSVMETSKHDLITLAEEIEILRLYLQLEHSRFKQNFDYEFLVSETIDASEFELPPMIIQPFIENAIWHGLRYKEGKGFLKVEIEGIAEDLLITVTDNGIGRKKSGELKTKNQKLQNSTGMQNIENRIRIMNELFNTNIRADVADAFPSESDTGTLVKLFIPKKINAHA